MSYIHRTGGRMVITSDSKDSVYSQRYREVVLKEYQEKLKEWEKEVKELKSRYAKNISVWKEKSSWYKILLFFMKPKLKLPLKPENPFP